MEVLIGHVLFSLVFEAWLLADRLFYHVYVNWFWSMHGLKYPLLVKRLACLVIAGVTSSDCLDILQPATLSSEMIFLMEKEFSLLRSSFQDVAITSQQLTFLTKEWYISVLARIRINSFRVELTGGLYEDLFSLAAASVNAEAAVGTAVYMLPSFYNHDCGEEMRICYIDASMDYEARQALLFTGFGFKCNCLRCSSHD